MKGRWLETIIKAFLIACFAAYLAYYYIGWIGIAIFGLFVAMIALRVEMYEATPTGERQASERYAALFQNQQLKTRAEKAAQRAEWSATQRIVNLAKAIGGVLALIGLLGFLLLQLPR